MRLGANEVDGIGVDETATDCALSNWRRRPGVTSPLSANGKDLGGAASRERGLGLGDRDAERASESTLS